MIKINEKKIFTIFVLLLPILNIYATRISGSLCFGEFLGVLLFPILFFSHLIKQKNIHLCNKYYIFFICYLTIISIVLTFFIEEYSLVETITKVLKTCFYTAIVFSLSIDFFDYKYAKQIYIYIALGVSIYLIMQFVAYAVFSVRLPVVLPNMRLFYNEIKNSTMYYSRLQKMYLMYGIGFRNSSIFLEPAHFIEYVIYSVVLLLFDEKNKEKNKIWEVVVITVAILLSRSTLGYILIALIYALWIFNTIKWINIKKIIVVNAIVLFFVYISVKFNLFSYALMRIATVRDSRATTGTMRLLRGIVVYFKLPMFFKIVGMGAGNYAAFVEKYNIITTYDQNLIRTNEFMNGFSTVLVYTGLIGLYAYLMALYQIYREADKRGKVILIVLLVLLLSSDIFFRATYVLGLILAVYGEREQEW